MAPTSSIDYPDDPWNSPDLHKHHDHSAEASPRQSIDEPGNVAPAVNGDGNGISNDPYDSIVAPSRTTSTFTTSSVASAGDSVPTAPTREPTFVAASLPGAGWGGADFFADDPVVGIEVPGGSSLGREPGSHRSAPLSTRTIGSGRTGGAVEENIVVSLLPEKEGMFMFQHHNYEVASARRGSKVIRRYSDFVWLLDCMHKRYPFRALPLLPPKRVAGTSKDTEFQS